MTSNKFNLIYMYFQHLDFRFMCVIYHGPFIFLLIKYPSFFFLYLPPYLYFFCSLQLSYYFFFHRRILLNKKIKEKNIKKDGVRLLNEKWRRTEVICFLFLREERSKDPVTWNPPSPVPLRGPSLRCTPEEGRQSFQNQRGKPGGENQAK